MKSLVLIFIRLYRFIGSPWLGNQCRFYPTCSAYAEEAISMHGLCRGGWLSIKRLLKCHPWHPGGVDLVPECEHPERPHQYTPSTKG